jgi:hypothetical protein
MAGHNRPTMVRQCAPSSPRGDMTFAARSGADYGRRQWTIAQTKSKPALRVALAEKDAAAAARLILSALEQPNRERPSPIRAEAASAHFDR